MDKAKGGARPSLPSLLVSADCRCNTMADMSATTAAELPAKVITMSHSWFAVTSMPYTQLPKPVWLHAGMMSLA